jgi:DNA-binding GntR family transcriptional regulator
MKRISRNSLSDEVETRLKEVITSGQLQPGDFISIADLSRQFGTSVTPVRDAIHRLRTIGFVNVLPRKEIRVANLDDKKLRNVFGIRMALEGLAIREATKQIPDAELERSWQILCEAEAQFSTTMKIEDLLPQDTLVHDLIFQYCDNDMLISVMRGFRDLSRWARQTVIYYEPQAVFIALSEHKEILTAMRARLVAEAENALLRHLKNSLERALSRRKA